MAVINLDQIRDIDRIKDIEGRMLAAAIYYAERGFYVVPIRPNGKALPGKRHNFNYQHASRNVKKVTEWYQPGGKYEGWNIGLATGKRDGIFVVDLDVHNPEENGLQEFESLVPEDYQYHGPVQETPSGGKHLLFNWRESAASSTNKIGPGIDTRGGEFDECKGHIVVWPSVVDGTTYRWETGGEVPSLPEFIINKMGRPWNTTMGSGRGNEFIGEDDVEDSFSLDQIKAMLICIDPNELSYDEWLETGHAIHSQHPTDEGLKLWNEWSSQGERYERDECFKRWAGFNPGGAIRIGTLIHYAKQRGYELNHIPEPNKDEIDALVDRLNERFAIVPMGSDVLVLEEVDVPEDVKRIQPKYRFFKKQGFRNLLENQVMIMGTEKGPVKKSHADIWLAHEDRRTYPSGVGMFPNKPARYQGYYNLWGGFSIRPEPGDWSLLKSHIRDIICDGDDNLYGWVLDWLADLVQDPANPKGCAIVMHGIEGCGKGTFAQFVGELFGTAFKHVTDEEHLVGRFNGHLADAVVVYADEVTYGGNKKVAGKLKALVTEKFITAERKGVDPVQFHNCAHLLVASNESWFIPAGPQSRRWLVLDCNGSKANDSEYFRAIHYQMEQESGLAGMLHELQGRQITRNLTKAPETEALLDQRMQYGDTGSDKSWWFQKLSLGILGVPSVEVEENQDWPEKVAKADIYNSYRDWCNDNRRRPVADNVFFKTLSQAGVKTTRIRAPGGRRVYAVVLPEYKEARKLAKYHFGFKDTDNED